MDYEPIKVHLHGQEWTLQQEDPPAEIKIIVVPQTVPTTTSPFHHSATHVDALGMPVAIYRDEWQGKVSEHPYHPTPCCGASATYHDADLCCKACWEYVDPAYGNVPVEPFRPISEVQ